MSKRTMCLILMACVPTLLLYGAGSWDIGNNTVTYSTTVSSIAFGNVLNAPISQFDTAAAAQEEGTSATYVLTRVVLSMDGAVVGTVTYINNNSTAQSPSATLIGACSSLSFGSFSTASETYNVVSSFSSVGAGETKVNPINNSGSGGVSSSDITTDLASFTGSGTINTLVSFNASGWFWANSGNESTKSESVTGTADISVTYYYDVPEPTSLALLGLGCVAILARRRFRKTTEI